MGRTYTSLTYHIVFSTKYRQSLILPDFQEELYRYIGGIIRSKEGVQLEIGGTMDHVHIMAALPAKISVSDMLRFIKTNSSSWVNQRPGMENQQKFEWQPGFGAFTVSHSGKEKLRAYIQNQKQHHAKKTYKDEFLAILVAHGIEYDPKLVFEDEHYG